MAATSGAAQANDDSLVTIQHTREGTLIAAVVDLARLDSTDVAGSPALVGAPTLALRMNAHGAGEHVAVAGPIQALVGSFASQPDRSATELAYRVDDAAPIVARARWTCAGMKPGPYSYGVVTPLAADAVRAMASARTLTLTVSSSAYAVTSRGMRTLRAFAAHLEVDSLQLEFTPPKTWVWAYYEYEVEKQATPKYQKMPLQDAPKHGEVVIEFVVDTTGHVQPRSSRIVRASDSAAARTVRQTVAGWEYDPAVACGHPVPQYVQVSMRFGTN